MLTYIVIGAGVVAVIKILLSRRGRVSIPGVHITWGN
jgi:hypothetical protein